MSGTKITCTKVGHTYPNGVQAIKDVDVTIEQGEVVSVVGQNGSGKSTMLDAVSFSLFGKPHRNINKPQLINSINNKSCIVEVEFLIGKNYYKIVRGIKPGKFEI